MPQQIKPSGLRTCARKRDEMICTLNGCTVMYLCKNECRCEKRKKRSNNNNNKKKKKKKTQPYRKEQRPFVRYEKTHIKINNLNIMESNVSMPLSLTTVAYQPMKLCSWCVFVFLYACEWVSVCVCMVDGAYFPVKNLLSNATRFLFRFANTKPRRFLMLARCLLIPSLFFFFLPLLCENVLFSRFALSLSLSSSAAVSCYQFLMCVARTQRQTLYLLPQSSGSGRSSSSSKRRRMIAK